MCQLCATGVSDDKHELLLAIDEGKVAVERVLEAVELLVKAQLVGHDESALVVVVGELLVAVEDKKLLRVKVEPHDALVVQIANAELVQQLAGRVGHHSYVLLVAHEHLVVVDGEQFAFDIESARGTGALTEALDHAERVVELAHAVLALGRVDERDARAAHADGVELVEEYQVLLEQLELGIEQLDEELALAAPKRHAYGATVHAAGAQRLEVVVELDPVHDAQVVVDDEEAGRAYAAVHLLVQEEYLVLGDERHEAGHARRCEQRLAAQVVQRHLEVVVELADLRDRVEAERRLHVDLADERQLEQAFALGEAQRRVLDARRHQLAAVLLDVGVERLDALEQRLDLLVAERCRAALVVARVELAGDGLEVLVHVHVKLVHVLIHLVALSQVEEHLVQALLDVVLQLELHRGEFTMPLLRLRLHGA